MKSHRTQLSKLGMWKWRRKIRGGGIAAAFRCIAGENCVIMKGHPKKLSLRKYGRCFCARIWTACGEHNAKNIKAMHAPILIGRNVSGCDCHYVRTSESQVELTHLCLAGRLTHKFGLAGVSRNRGCGVGHILYSLDRSKK